MDYLRRIGFGIGLAFLGVACVDTNRTNKTMESQLEELKTLNKNLTDATDRLAQPIEGAASSFQRLSALLEQDYGSMRDGMVQLQSKTNEFFDAFLPLARALKPEDLVANMDRIRDLSTQLKELNENVRDFQPPFRAGLRMFAANGEVLTKMGLGLGLIPVEEARRNGQVFADYMANVSKVAESAHGLGVAIAEKAGEASDELATHVDVMDKYMPPDTTFMEQMEDFRNGLDRMNGTMDKALPLLVQLSELGKDFSGDKGLKALLTKQVVDLTTSINNHSTSSDNFRKQIETLEKTYGGDLKMVFAKIEKTDPETFKALANVIKMFFPKDFKPEPGKKDQ